MVQLTQLTGLSPNNYNGGTGSAILGLYLVPALFSDITNSVSASQSEPLDTWILAAGSKAS